MVSDHTSLQTIISVWRRRVTHAIQLLRIFPVQDAIKYRRLNRHGRQLQQVAIRVRALGGRVVLCRCGTSDKAVLRDTFIEGYHRPTWPVRGSAVIIDLGCNVGYTTADFAARYPDAVVVGVEMDAANAELAKLNTAAFGSRVTIVNAAVWNEDGELGYTATNGEWAFRVSKLDGDACATKRVRSVTLDTLFEMLQISRVDFMKIDVEGAEAAILQADACWLQKVTSIALEVHGPATMEGCVELLTNAGFRCERSKQLPMGLLARRP